MECEICGKPAVSRALVEDSVVRVCNSCAAFGKPVASIVEQPPVLAANSAPSLPPAPVFCPDSAERVRQARERLGLTRKQLAGRLKEKAATIERIERGMRPDAALAKKLEKALGIRLLDPDEAAPRAPRLKLAPGKQAEITLGDIADVSIKKRRRSP